MTAFLFSLVFLLCCPAMKNIPRIFPSRRLFCVFGRFLKKMQENFRLSTFFPFFRQIKPGIISM